jgi:hypothetical protein
MDSETPIHPVSLSASPATAINSNESFPEVSPSEMRKMYGKPPTVGIVHGDPSLTLPRSQRNAERYMKRTESLAIDTNVSDQRRPSLPTPRRNPSETSIRRKEEKKKEEDNAPQLLIGLPLFVAVVPPTLGMLTGNASIWGDLIVMALVGWYLHWIMKGSSI